VGVGLAKFQTNHNRWPEPVRTCRKSSMFLVHIACAKTVSKPLPFDALEFCLSEKQTPQVIVFIGRRQNEESV
jgi:hypothetical protein